MRLDYFTRFGEKMFVAHVENPDDTDWQDVTSWLFDAPEQAPNSAMMLWTELALMLIKNNEIEESEDVQVLQGYFTRMASLPDSEFVALTLLPPFESLMRNLQPTVEETPGTISALVQSGWSPAALLGRIEQHRDAILAANMAKKTYPVPLTDTGAGGFCKTLFGVLGNGTWTPEPSPVYAQLFEMYVVSSSDFQKEDSTFIRNVLHAAPEELHMALWFARRQEYFSETHLQALFPMPLTTLNAAYMLDSLVALVVDEPERVVGKTMPLLHKHHPELAALVSMHCSLFPDATPGKTWSEMLVEPYLGILGKDAASTPAHETIDASVFETMDHGQ